MKKRKIDKKIEDVNEDFLLDGEFDFEDELHVAS